MNPLDQLLDALDTVMAWDLQDEELADALNTQVGLMAGMSPDELPHPAQESLFV